MIYFDPIIQRRLDQAIARRKWLRVLQHSASLGTIVSFLVLLLGVAAVCGWITSVGTLRSWFIIIGIVTAIVWLVTGVIADAGRPEESRLIRAIERVCPPLLDRLNTLVFLSKWRNEPRVDSFYYRIERQAQSVLASEAPPFPYSPARALAHLCVFAAMLLATVYFYHRFAPVERLRAAAQLEKPLQVAEKEAAAAKEATPWGEVNITKPGYDLAVTRVETVPLQIEASAADPVKQAEWFTAINGGNEQRHDLPPPSDPRYAVYQTAIEAEKSGLSDWDVLMYYAKATTDKGDSFASRAYFLEVRPFQDELRKLPGGQAGRPYSVMGQLTTLIERQEEVVQEAHRQQYDSDKKSDWVKQEPALLAMAENELATATSHLASRIAGELDKAPVAGSVSHLDQAEASLRRAASAFRDRALAEAQVPARAALADMIASRKELQQSFSENPAAFVPPSQDEQTLARDVEELLKRISGASQQAKTAADSVREMAQTQREIAQRTRAAQVNPSPKQKPAKPSPGGAEQNPTYRRLADEENALRQKLAEFEKQNPGLCQRAQKECANARTGVQQAADALQRAANPQPQSTAIPRVRPSPKAATMPPQAAGTSQRGGQEAQERTSSATVQLDRLAQALETRISLEQMANAYRLKRMLDEQIKLLERLEQQPDRLTEQQLQEAVRKMKNTTSQLKRIAEEEPTSQCFGPKLREALSDQNKQNLDSQCDSLCNAQGSGARKQAAGAAKAGLQQVSQAFSDSEPQLLAQEQQGGSLQPGGQLSLDRGIRNLESLTQSSQDGRPLSREARMKLQQEAAANLLGGIENLPADSPPRRDAQRSLRELTDPRTPADERIIQKLVEQLRNLSIETVEVRDRKPDEPNIRYIDPAKLPPAYRERIQKYFEKLSQQ